ncbi:MAG: purine-nucleoside phosphorylase [Clostridia bacterium]|nr:purine-nucleoside phosphorylase [Clostridia bacterium]
MTYDYDYYKKSADYVLAQIGYTPEIALILGSCLGDVAREIENPIVIDYKDIPNYLVSTVESHAGKLICGTLGGKKVVCMSGRFHYYEGYEFEQLAAPIRLFKLLGVRATILTNAAGAVNTGYRPGDVMIIRDHLNLCGVAPTRGRNAPEFGPRFFDVTNMYTPELRALARECGTRSPLRIQEGVYMYFTGPQFETPAEIRAARVLGADAVGMSTVTEALTAAHCGMPLLGLSLMTNMAAGVLPQPLTTAEVDETARGVADKMRAYVIDILAHM